MRSATVSAKIPKELREKLRKYGVRVTPVIERALEEEVSKLEEQELKAKLDEVSRNLKNKVSVKDVVLAVRGSREGR